MADEAYPLPGVSSITSLAQWESFFGAVTPTSGVVVGSGSELAGSLDVGGRNAVVATGAALIRGFYKPISAATSTAIPGASAANRVDRLVLRLDRSASVAANFAKPAVLTGTSGSTVPPTLSSSPTGLWDLPICRWTSASSGTLTGLVDERQFLDKGTRKCTSGNRPLNPSAGDTAFETDTYRWIGWTGFVWTVLGAAPTWQPLTITSGFKWLGSGHHPEYMITGMGQVRLRGLVARNSGYLANADQPVSVPAPGGTLSSWFVAAATSTSVGHSVRWQIDAAGHAYVQWNATGYSPNWASLDGITYDQV